MKKIYPESKGPHKQQQPRNEEQRQDEGNNVSLFEKMDEPSKQPPNNQDNELDNNDDDDDLSLFETPPIPIIYQNHHKKEVPIIYEYEIPKLHPLNNEEDEEEFNNNHPNEDNISDESSLDSQRNKKIQDYRKSKRESKKHSIKYQIQQQQLTNFQQQKQELKEKIITEILDKILPNLDEYNIDGTNNQSNKNSKRSKLWSIMIACFKFLGCLSLDLHDAVLAASITKTRQTILKLTRGKDANPELINEYDQYGCTAISYAVKIKQYDLVQLLLDYNALPDFIDLKTGRTPLFYSVNNGTIEITRLLLQSGANANAVDNQCVAPLMLAATRNDVKHCQFLCMAFADVDVQDDNGWTALHYAAYGNAPEVIYYLLSEGANRHLKDRNRRKPMHIAKFKNHGNCIAALSTKSKIGF